MGETKSPKKAKLSTEMLQVLREKNRDLERQVSGLKQAVREAENDRVSNQVVANGAKASVQLLYSAVRILAAEVSNDTAQGRKIRHAARALVEEANLTPPSTLGKTRERKKPRGRPKKS